MARYSILLHRPHPHCLRVAHRRRDRRLVDGEGGETLVHLARDVAAEAGADLAPIDQGLGLASCQMQGREAAGCATDPSPCPLLHLPATFQHYRSSIRGSCDVAQIKARQDMRLVIAVICAVIITGCAAGGGVTQTATSSDRDWSSAAAGSGGGGGGGGY